MLFSATTHQLAAESNNSDFETDCPKNGHVQGLSAEVSADCGRACNRPYTAPASPNSAAMAKTQIGLSVNL
jgi:hypothetical protein